MIGSAERSRDERDAAAVGGGVQSAREPRSSPRGTLRSVVQLLRPKHYIKNVFVLAPLIFAQRLADPASVIAALAAAVLFSVAASTVYLLNDLVDADRDRSHPTKAHRPIASGAVSPRVARALLLGLLTLLAAGTALLPAIVPGIAAYLLINVAYTYSLKHVAVVDIFCVASGFVLRVWVGALAIGVVLSSWMMITTLCLALYLAATKRRQELAARGHASRAVLAVYSLPLLDRYAEMSGIGAIVFYGLYVTEVQPALAITVPLVIFGLFRYWYVVEGGGGESPTDVMWADVPLVLTLVSWAVLSIVLIGRAPVIGG